jgi:hypothetical protein
MNYARRQQYRRLSRAARAAAGSVLAIVLALVVWRVGAAPLAGALLTRCRAVMRVAVHSARLRDEVGFSAWRRLGVAGGNLGGTRPMGNDRVTRPRMPAVGRAPPVRPPRGRSSSRSAGSAS